MEKASEQETISITDVKQEKIRKEIAELESKLSVLKGCTQILQDKLDGILLKQIEIMTVFIVVISLIITNIIGIDAFGNIGIRGLVRINLVMVLAIFIILLGVKLFILGFKRRNN